MAPAALRPAPLAAAAAAAAAPPAVTTRPAPKTAALCRGQSLRGLDPSTAPALPDPLPGLLHEYVDVRGIKCAGRRASIALLRDGLLHAGLPLATLRCPPCDRALASLRRSVALLMKHTNACACACACA